MNHPIRESAIAQLTGIPKRKLVKFRGMEGTDWYRADTTGRPVWWSSQAFFNLTNHPAYGGKKILCFTENTFLSEGGGFSVFHHRHRPCGAGV